MRPFSKWAGRQIEDVCTRNDHARPGKPKKPPWEKTPPGDLYRKLDEECLEMIEAYIRWTETPTPDNMRLLQWELADLATSCMQLSARLDPVMLGLRRGKLKLRDFPKGVAYG